MIILLGVMIFGMSLETVVAIAIPAVTATFFIVRHIWGSTKSMAILKLRADSSDKLAIAGQKDHKLIFEKINRIDKRVVSIETKLDMLLKK